MANKISPLTLALEPPSSRAWVTADGRAIPINKMADAHILNVINYQVTTNVFNSGPRLNMYKWVLEEADRRGLNTKQVSKTSQERYTDMFL